MLKPVNHYVVVRPINPPKQSAGGILYPDNLPKPANRGIVISAEPYVSAIKAGDEVYISSYAGTKVEDDGIEYWLIQEKDIMAIIEKEEK